MLKRNATARSFTLLCALVCVSACGKLIGIDDHRFVAGDAGPGDTTDSCERYCDLALENCADDPVQAYATNGREDCLAICERLPAGERAGETSGNSVSCRLHYAEEASGAERNLDFCPAVAPGGGSPGVTMPACGDNCSAYCDLYDQVCPERADSRCEERCPGLPDRGGYSSVRDFNGKDDTIQCRLAHLTAAARYQYDGERADSEGVRSNADSQRMLHCGHAKLVPSLMNDGMPCDLPPDTAPNCKDYCKLVQVACSRFPVYESDAQCEAVCDKGFAKPVGLPMGTTDISDDTLACRRWHAYFALGTPDEHCPHAGPSGDGHCGTVCPAYCGMLERACGDRYEREFDNSDECRMQCETALTKGAVKDIGYNVRDSEEIRTNTYQCRIRKLAQIFEGTQPNACDTSVFPMDRCQ